MRYLTETTQYLFDSYFQEHIFKKIWYRKINQNGVICFCKWPRLLSPLQGEDDPCVSDSAAALLTYSPAPVLCICASLWPLAKHVYQLLKCYRRRNFPCQTWGNMCRYVDYTVGCKPSLNIEGKILPSSRLPHHATVECSCKVYPAWLKHLKILNSWKHPLQILKSNQKIIKSDALHYFDEVTEIVTLLITF